MHFQNSNFEQKTLPIWQKLCTRSFTYTKKIFRSRNCRQKFIENLLLEKRKGKFKSRLNNVNVEERAQRITNIGLKCKSNGKSNIVVSSILKRNSFNIIQVTYQVNNILKGLCRPNDLFYICNGLVNENHLCKDVLHLTNEGSSLLLNNFINYLNGNVNNNI